jgi:hypothetical protein
MIRQGASEDKTARQRPADFTRRHYGMVGLQASVAAQSRAVWYKIWMSMKAKMIATSAATV